MLAALAHREPGRVPTGELATDHGMVEADLSRPALYRSHFKTTRALWEGRRERWSTASSSTWSSRP
ncbi:MAG TPA: hypothetical protein VLH79_10520 [Chthonomonadales bacterium]|nr:hypothetical protein [Chthonomonadales bacterium]